LKALYWPSDGQKISRKQYKAEESGKYKNNPDIDLTYKLKIYICPWKGTRFD
jgi:hypothetical protein